MRRLAFAVLTIATAVSPSPAKAGFFAEGSLGVPWHTTPGLYREPTNLMVTPGYELLWVSAELGVVASFSQFQRSSTWGLRPTVGLRPPMLPVYGKLLFDIHDLSHGTVTSVGGALGYGFDLLGLGIFLEGAYIPRKVNGQSLNIWEARLGVSVGR